MAIKHDFMVLRVMEWCLWLDGRGGLERWCHLPLMVIGGVGPLDVAGDISRVSGDTCGGSPGLLKSNSVAFSGPMGQISVVHCLRCLCQRVGVSLASGGRWWPIGWGRWHLQGVWWHVFWIRNSGEILSAGVDWLNGCNIGWQAPLCRWFWRVHIIHVVGPILIFPSPHDGVFLLILP